MKKLLFSVLFLFCITVCSTFAATTVEFTIDSTTYATQKDVITKNTLQAAPFIKNNRTMVPVRALCEAFNCTVGWDEPTRTVTISKHSDEEPLTNKDISIVIDSDKIVVNGEVKTIDCPAEIVNDITFLPLRAVSENLGYYVYYVDFSRQILIDDIPPIATVNDVSIPYNAFKAMYTMNASSVPEGMEAYLASEVYSQLEDIYTMYSDAVKNQITLSADVKAYLLEQEALLEADEKYGSVILASSYAKLLQDYQLASANAANIMASVEAIDDVTFSEFYKNNYVCAKHILIAFDTHAEAEALSLANEIYKRAAAGEDFDMLVDDFGEDPGMVGNKVGYVFTKGEMVKEFEETSFSLKNGEISKPVKTTYGYHIILKLPLPNDAQSLASAKEKYAAMAYNDILTKLYSAAVTTNSYPPEVAYSFLLSK